MDQEYREALISQLESSLDFWRWMQRRAKTDQERQEAFNNSHGIRVQIFGLTR